MRLPKLYMPKLDFHCIGFGSQECTIGFENADQAAECIRRVELHDDLLEALLNLRTMVEIALGEEVHENKYFLQARAAIAKAEGA